MRMRFDFKSWRKNNPGKEIETEDLTRIINPGTKIFIGTAASEPIPLTKELNKEKLRWVDCQLIHFLTISKQKYFSEKHPTLFRHNTLSIIGSPQVRKAVFNGKSDFTPVASYQLSRLLREKIIPIDVCLLQVSPPDAHGFCSLGTNVDINKTVAESANTIVAQINPKMPHTRGSSDIHISSIDYYIYEERPLLEFSYGNSFKDSLTSKIGKFVNRLIENSCTLNIGLGSIPNSIWPYLQNKRNLAIYTEVLVLSDELISLIEKKIINCNKSLLDHIAACFVLGKERHYRYIDDNAFIKVYPTEYLLNSANIKKNHKICSIYGAMFVDLTGNTSNHRPSMLYGGLGGEMDFLQAESQSKKGKNIIVLPSTTRDGKKSRIQATIQRTTIPAPFIQYVVTEFGIAKLAGKNLRNRALQLIGIAHPRFRKHLLEEAKRLKYVYEDQILPLTRDGSVVIYPEKYEWTFTIDEKHTLQFRPVKTTDEPLLQQFYYSLTKEDRNLRFLTPKRIFPHNDTQTEVNIDYENNMMILGLSGTEESQKIVSAGSYHKNIRDSTNLAEIAITVAPEWQNKGIGTHIFGKLIDIAQENSISGFVGELYTYNTPILKILDGLSYQVDYTHYGETIEFTLWFRKKRNIMEVKNPSH